MDHLKTHMEVSIERDIDRIRSKVREMARLVEQALIDCIKAISESSYQRTYAVVLRDQHVNEKELEIDRLCLEFLVRQQPVAMPLRFAYSTIKINLEIERVGDYAESIARQLLHNREPIDQPLKDRIVELGKLAMGLFHDAVKSFLEQDAEQAKKCIKAADAIDPLRSKLDDDIAACLNEKKMSYALHASLITIVRRFERVSDQARNICMEVLYLCTGHQSKHPGAEFFRVLFVDRDNACLSQMAEAIAHEQKQIKFIFSSAGIEPSIVDPDAIEFMKQKGHDLTRSAPKAIQQIPHLDHYQVIVTLDKEAYRGFPKAPSKIVFLDWHVDCPSEAHGSKEEKEKAFSEAYDFLASRINELIVALKSTGKEK
ncbi:MAG: phosphate signaling complex protein PhoU [Chitinispirillaceae bacterium]|nr:phosphate signaling complex protein PhoU [Chitinispirillaceae bacterium]